MNLTAKVSTRYDGNGEGLLSSARTIATILVAPVDINHGYNSFSCFGIVLSTVQRLISDACCHCGCRQAGFDAGEWG